MIQNECEYEVTKRQIQLLQSTFDGLPADDADPLLRAERDGVASMLDDLPGELLAYEELRARLDKLARERGERDGREGEAPLEALPSYLDGFRAGRDARREEARRVR